MRRLPKRLAVSITALALTLLLAEGLTRLFSDVHAPLGRRDPRIGYRYARDVDVEIYVPESERRVRLRFNDDGFRGPSRPRRKPAGTCRVAILGDSQIAAIATREEDTLVGRLEDRLRSWSPGVRWEVLNFGVSGSSTAQELVLYRELVSRFAPDVVVLAYFEGNDLIDNSDRLSWASRIYMDLDDEGRLFQKPFSTARASGSSWLNRNSRFYVWQKERVNRVLHRMLDDEGLNVRGGGGGQTYRTDDSPDLRHAWRLTRALIDDLRNRVEADEGHFLLLYVPAAEGVDPHVWRARFGDSGGPSSRDPSYPRRRIGRMAGALGVDAVFLTEPFRAASESDPEPLFYNGEGHINERGQDLAAREILAHLARSGTLARREERCAHALAP